MAAHAAGGVQALTLGGHEHDLYLPLRAVCRAVWKHPEMAVFQRKRGRRVVVCLLQLFVQLFNM